MRKDVRASVQFKDICPNSYHITSLLLYNKFSQNYWHETIHVYYLTDCVAAGSCSAGSFARLQSGCRQRLQGSTPSSTGVKLASRLTQRLLARFSSPWAVGLKASVPRGCWPECPQSLPGGAFITVSRGDLKQKVSAKSHGLRWPQRHLGGCSLGGWKRVKRGFATEAQRQRQEYRITLAVCCQVQRTLKGRRSHEGVSTRRQRPLDPCEAAFYIPLPTDW